MMQYILQRRLDKIFHVSRSPSHRVTSQLAISMSKLGTLERVYNINNLEEHLKEAMNDNEFLEVG